VYDTQSRIFRGASPEIVMHTAPKKATYRFSAFIETQPGEACEYDTVLYFVQGYVRPDGVGVQERHKTIVDKDGRTEREEIPASVFRVEARTDISYHVEYEIGGDCKVRPAYQVFPLLERMQ